MITSLKEYQQTVAGIFEEAKIKVFSVTSTIGHRDDHTADLLDNWFASGEEQFDSIFLFSFTGDANAAAAMELVKKHNRENQTDFPIRAFILPVEHSSDEN